MGRARSPDAVIAVALAVAGQVEAWSVLHTGALVAATMLPGPLALLFRRRAPTAVVLAAFACFPVQALLGSGMSEAFAPLLAGLVAVGSAAYYARRPVLALALAVGLVWVAQVVASGLEPAELLWQAMLVSLGWSVGRGIAAGALRAQLSEQRASAAVIEERLRIARELHDVVAHSVSVMLLHAGGVRRLLGPDQRVEREGLEVVESTGRQALAEMQRTLGLLRGESSGLDQAGRLLEPARAAGLSAELRVEGEPCALPPGLDQSAYRILQEAVSNVLRHADATTVEAVIGFGQGSVRLEVHDDGAARTDALPGHGLTGMRERVTLHGGALEAGPAPGGGFRVVAVLPVPREAP